jgi:hypothetical protein
MGALAGNKPDFKIIFWPLSLDINDANPVARPALGSLLMLYISRNKGYCLVAK